MEFHVLRPLQVIHEGESLHVSSAYKPRLLLGILLAHAGKVVNADTLIEGLWQQDVPSSARRNLHQYIHRLRSALGAEMLPGRSGGYAILIDAESLDSTRFLRLAADGADALAHGDHVIAAKLLHEGLNLWHGRAYEEFLDCELIATESARLEQARLAAYEHLAAAELALGKAAQLVPVLTGLVREHPFEENICGQLMRALATSGRQAEALQVFRNTRAALREQLGIEPGPKLQAVHQAILRGEELKPAEQAPPVSRVPQQLPPDASHYVGRENELSRFRQLAESEPTGFPKISAVYGSAGTGKSALAVRGAHAIAGHFPDGQLYLDLQGSTPGISCLDPLEGLARWLRALGVDGRRIPVNIPEAAALFRELTADRRMLLVLDNAQGAQQVRPLLPASHHCLVIVTSRGMLSTLDNASHTRIDVLSDLESLALLAEFDERVLRLEEQPHAAAIIASCGRLPLALRVIGAKLASRPDWSPATVAQRLSDQQSRLDELQQQDLSVRASISVSLQGLAMDPGGQTADALLHHLGLLDCPELTLPLAAALMEQPHSIAQGALDRLADEQIIQPRQSGRYVLHDLIRLYAREQASSRLPQPQRDAALSRVLDHYLTTSSAAANLLLSANPRIPKQVTAVRAMNSAEAAHTWIEAELSNIVAFARQSGVSNVAATRSLADLISTVNLLVFHVLYRWPEMLDLSRIAADIGTSLGDHRVEARARENLALSLCALDRPAEAAVEAKRSLELHGEGTGDSDPRDVHGSVLALTYAYAHLGRNDLLTEHLERAVVVCRAGGYRVGEASALDALGRCYRYLGRMEEAIAAHEAGMAIRLELNDEVAVAASTESMGWATLHSGDAEAALRYFEESHRFAQTVPYYPILRATGLWGIATAQYTLGDADSARSAWREAMTILKPLHVLRPGEVDYAETEGIPNPPWIIAALI